MSTSMRAMILAAGRGTRMLPLTRWRPKPALPVRGLPLVGWLFALLEGHGVREAIVNLHHLPDEMQHVAERCRPEGLEIRFSRETELLGTGGGLRRAADFLRESDPCLVLAGDMVLDADLTGFAARHRERGDRVTLLLRRDPRGRRFGTIGVDADGRVRRIGNDFDLGGETDAGVFVGVRAIAARAFDSLPDRDAFEDLRDWLAPLLAHGVTDVRGEIASASACIWEPVGTPQEYLSANLHPPRVSYFATHEVEELGGVHVDGTLVVGAGARLGEAVHLERAVVWDGEKVPDATVETDGVFAGGMFHPVGRVADAAGEERGE